MKRVKSNKLTTAILALSTCTMLGACSAMDRVANIGQAPEVTQISNPVTAPDYQPVSLPMPAPTNVSKKKNSLWTADRTTFFKDQRASDVGDIITVLIDIDDKAELENETERSRSSSEGANLNRILGIEQSLDRVLPEAIKNPSTGLLDPSLADFDSDSSHTGNGSIDRDEKIRVQLAALVTQILPNGNMVVSGRQEVLVNFEKRILRIDGVIRPEDISTANTISYEQIAEARIVYGGEGQITDVQQPRYGQQLYDIIFPF